MTYPRARQLGQSKTLGLTDKLGDDSCLVVLEDGCAPLLFRNWTLTDLHRMRRQGLHFACCVV